VRMSAFGHKADMLIDEATLTALPCGPRLWGFAKPTTSGSLAAIY